MIIAGRGSSILPAFLLERKLNFFDVNVIYHAKECGCSIGTFPHSVGKYKKSKPHMQYMALYVFCGRKLSYFNSNSFYGRENVS